MDQTIKKPVVMIMAGGTGGHVFPGLAVARRLQQEGFSIHWLGTPQGIEAKIIPAASIPIEYITINGLRGKGWRSLLAAPWKLVRAVQQATRILRKIQPCVVVGMGGFASGPGGFAAWLLRKPLVIHEQNAVSGYTNRALAHFAQQVLVSFPNTFPARYRPVFTGNPLREEFNHIPTPEERLGGRVGALRILVLGGSQGATVLNDTVPAALALLKDYPLEIQVRHASGEKALPATQLAYQKAGIEVELHPFISDVANAYSWADLCICRSGALTVAELCAVGLGAVIVPFPQAVDDHQTKNAEPLVAAGAAVVIQQKDLSAKKLAEAVKAIIKDRQTIISMATAARHLININATEQVAKHIKGVCNATRK